MRVLGLCSYPIEAAATRYRLAQFVEPLARAGIDLEISSLIGSDEFKFLYQKKSLSQKIFRLGNPLFQRFVDSFKMKSYDMLLVQREVMFFGPAFFERLYRRIGKMPMVLDLDDATYVSYVSPTYGKIGSFFKFFGKTDQLIKMSETVVCGNRFIAEYVESKGAKAVIVPTVVDTAKFRPAEKVEKRNALPVVGWIGTHSTYPLLESIFPVLRRLAAKHEFVLKIVGAGRETITLDGVRVENVEWNLEREIADFQSLDIGLYPIKTLASASDAWLLGKSGFKAIQYLAVGIPFVVTPIGVCAEIGEPNRTHFNAVGEEDWYNAIDKLLTDENLRKKMGAEARRTALANFTMEQQAEKLAAALTEAHESFNKINKN